MSDELKSKIHEWINKQGYPLEMRLANQVRKHAGFEFRQSWNYEDQETGKSREIDLICTTIDHMGLCDINFVFECKGTSKPWILFASKDTAQAYGRLFSFGLMSQPARSAISDQVFDLVRDPPFKEAKKIPWFWKTGNIGYSLVQAFDGNKDVPYAAVLSAVKASMWLQENSVWQSEHIPRHVVSFPIVITSSPLFECSSDNSGDMQLAEISHGYLFFNSPTAEFKGTCVSIVQEQYIETFIKECNTVSNILMKHLKPSLKIEYEKLKNFK